MRAADSNILFLRNIMMLMPSKRPQWSLYGSALILSAALGACGELTQDEKSEPPPLVAADSERLFALENGSYFVKEIESLDDGCQKNPLDPKDSLTQVEFFLENRGDGQIALDFCFYNGQGTQGTVRGNQGILTASHSQRHIGVQPNLGIFDQRCTIKINITQDNTIRGQFTEYQSSRNRALRLQGVNASECTTRFDFLMKKKDSDAS